MNDYDLLLKPDILMFMCSYFRVMCSDRTASETPLYVTVLYTDTQEVNVSSLIQEQCMHISEIMSFISSIYISLLENGNLIFVPERVVLISRFDWSLNALGSYRALIGH